ncbi:hypothetical protein [Aureimonas leprariae]|uniref:Uncharacterized protein n=1 Tax=Plantimonas leprariae TaxID=2615207 RepID=A0A7V7TUV1_9HYPH|nr:hypothetical protein [Aureimonas leprariae]KAB0676717.1 hypothetical protein F6X38_20670 [Aureimonas leprariae]
MSDDGARDARPAYNPLYERFVTDDQSTSDQLTGMVAYGLYKQAKREWTTAHYERHGRKPSEDELASYIATWTPSMVQNLREQANGIVLAFGGFLVEENAPRIREEALRGTFWKAVGVSIFAAALYTLGLIALLVILRIAGVDILSILTSVNGAAG